MASDSKKIPTGDLRPASSRAIPMVIMTFRANLDTLLVIIRSIFPDRQSEIISLNASLYFREVPLIPSSAYMLESSNNRHKDSFRRALTLFQANVAAECRKFRSDGVCRWENLANQHNTVFSRFFVIPTYLVYHRLNISRNGFSKRLETVNGRSGRLMSSTFSRPLRSNSIFLI